MLKLTGPLTSLVRGKASLATGNTTSRTPIVPYLSVAYTNFNPP